MAGIVEIPLGYEIQALYKPELKCNLEFCWEKAFISDAKMGYVRAEILKYWSFKSLILF